MQITTPQRLSVRSFAPGVPGLSAGSDRRTPRTVTARASQGGAQTGREEKVVSKVAASTAAALVAASLSLTGSVSAVETVPRNSVPDVSIAKDDEALGNAFQKIGIPGNAPKVADEFREKTPGIGEDPSKAVSRTKDAAGDVAQKAQNAAPDLSLAKDDEALGNAFQKIGIPGNAPKVADEFREKTPGIGEDPSKAVSRTKDAAKDAASKAQNAAPDLSLAKDDEALGNAFQKIGIPGNAPKVADEFREKTPGIGEDPSKAVSRTKDAAKDAAGKAQNAAPDLSLAKDDEALGNAFQKIGIPGNAPKVADEFREKTPGIGEDPSKAVQRTKDAAKDAAGKAQNAAPDLSLAKDDEALGNAFQKIGIPGNGPKVADKFREKTPGIGEDPQSAVSRTKDAAKDVASKAQNAAPDLSLAKDDEALGNAFQKIGIPGNGPKVADKFREKTPGIGEDPQSAVNRTKDAAKDVASKVSK